VSGIAVKRKIILQLIRTRPIKASTICPIAHPIESTIGVAARVTSPVTSEIERREAL